MTNDLKKKKKRKLIITNIFLWGVLVVGSTQFNVTGLIFCSPGAEKGNYYHGETAHVKKNKIDSTQLGARLWNKRKMQIGHKLHDFCTYTQSHERTRLSEIV